MLVCPSVRWFVCLHACACIVKCAPKVMKDLYMMVPLHWQEFISFTSLSPSPGREAEYLFRCQLLSSWVRSDQINCRKQLDMDQQDSSRMPICHNGDVPPRWQGHTKNIQEQHLFLAFCPLFHELEAPAWAIDQVFRFENMSKMPVALFSNTHRS